jgi:hypothetical protein
LLACVSLGRSVHQAVRPVFERVFREYGLPDAIRTDNGPPFSSVAAGGLSRLSVWWMKMGIRHERIAPGRPDQNGRHERMHGTLKAETASPPRSSLRAQQRAFDDFRTEYNDERPHEALGQQTPAEFYRPSLRTMPAYFTEMTYPKTMIAERTHPHGVLWFAGSNWYLNRCIGGELVGLHAQGEDQWDVYFGDVLLGRMDLTQMKPGSINLLKRPRRTSRRRPYRR